MSRSILLAALGAAAVAAPAMASIAVDSKVSTHTDAWGYCITRTFRVKTVSTFGHDPGTCWYVGVICGLEIKEHATNHTAIADNPTGIIPDEWMGAATKRPGQQVEISMMHQTFVIPQALFNDPNGILSGDVFMDSVLGFEQIFVPRAKGIVHPYDNAVELQFNFDLGAGLFIGANDPAFTGRNDGTVFQPVPAPATLALLALAPIATRRRR